MHSVVHDDVRISSTAVRAALAEGRMDVAQSYLGRPTASAGAWSMAMAWANGLVFRPPTSS